MKTLSLIFIISLFGFQLEAQKNSKDTTLTIDIADTNNIRCSFVQYGSNSVYIFSPVSFDSTTTLPLTIFVHGYNGFQPELYGGWINNIVQQKCVVIFPVYQNSVLDVPADYYNNTSIEIHLALKVLKQNGNPKVDTTKAIYLAHSLGGSITMKLMNHLSENKLPYPNSILLAQTGSGMLRVAEEDSYDSIPKDLLLLAFSGEDDWVVKDLFTQKVMKNTPNLNDDNKFNFKIKAVKYGKNRFRADHFIPCSYLDIVPQKMHLIAKNSTGITDTDFFDTEIYWQASSILLQMMENHSEPATFYNQLPELMKVGAWPDGTLIDALELEKK